MKKIVIVFISAIIFLTSCAPTYYKPKTFNVPLLEMKSDVQLSAQGNEESISIQGAYAVTNNIGVSLDQFFYYNQRSKSTYRSTEIGLGYFDKRTDILHYEAYLIGGLGKLTKTSDQIPTEFYTPPIGSLSSNYALLGVQQSIGLKWKYFEMAYTLRLLRQDFYNSEGNYIYNDKNEVDYLNQIDYQNIFEHGLTLRAGAENFKVQLQILKTNEIGRNALDTDFRTIDSQNVSIGIVYNFNPSIGG